MRNALSPKRAPHDLTSAGIVGLTVGKGITLASSSRTIIAPQPDSCLCAIREYRFSLSITANYAAFMTVTDSAEAARLDRIESSLAISQLPSRYAMALDA